MQATARLCTDEAQPTTVLQGSTSHIQAKSFLQRRKTTHHDHYASEPFAIAIFASLMPSQLQVLGGCPRPRQSSSNVTFQ